MDSVPKSTGSSMTRSSCPSRGSMTSTRTTVCRRTTSTSIRTSHFDKVEGGHVMSQEFARSATCAGLLFLCLMLSGCSGAEYLWEVRTASTTRPPSFNPTVFEQQPVAVLVVLAPPALHGHEVDLTLSLSRTLKKMEPKWKLVSPQDAATQINQQGLAAEYTRMRTSYELSDILDRDSLK